LTPESQLRDHLRTARGAIDEAHAFLILAEHTRSKKNFATAEWYQRQAKEWATKAIGQLNQVVNPQRSVQQMKLAGVAKTREPEQATIFQTNRREGNGN
jgi:hypothetical protein